MVEGLLDDQYLDAAEAPQDWLAGVRELVAGVEYDIDRPLSDDDE